MAAETRGDAALGAEKCVDVALGEEKCVDVALGAEKYMDMTLGSEKGVDVAVGAEKCVDAALEGVPWWVVGVGDLRGFFPALAAPWFLSGVGMEPGRASQHGAVPVPEQLCLAAPWEQGAAFLQLKIITPLMVFALCLRPSALGCASGEGGTAGKFPGILGDNGVLLSCSVSPILTFDSWVNLFEQRHSALFPCCDFNCWRRCLCEMLWLSYFCC